MVSFLFEKKDGLHNGCFSLYNNYKHFSCQINFSSNAQTKNFFKTRAIFFFKIQNIRLINPEISNTRVHKCTSIMGGGGELRVL